MAAYFKPLGITAAITRVSKTFEIVNTNPPLHTKDASVRIFLKYFLVTLLMLNVKLMRFVITRYAASEIASSKYVSAYILMKPSNKGIIPKKKNTISIVVNTLNSTSRRKFVNTDNLSCHAYA